MPFLFMQSPSLQGTYPLDTKDDKATIKAKLDVAKLVKIESLTHSMTIPVAPLRPSFSKAVFRTGTVEHNPVVVKRIVDQASIKLLECFLNQTVMPVLQILAGVAVNHEILGVPPVKVTMAPQWIMRFQNALISNYSYQSTADSTIVEDITIRYAAVGWEFKPQKNNKELNPGTIVFVNPDNSVATAHWPADVKIAAFKVPPDEEVKLFTKDYWT